MNKVFNHHSTKSISLRYFLFILKVVISALLLSSSAYAAAWQDMSLNIKSLSESTTDMGVNLTNVTMFIPVCVNSLGKQFL